MDNIINGACADDASGNGSGSGNGIGRGVARLVRRASHEAYWCERNPIKESNNGSSKLCMRALWQRAIWERKGIKSEEYGYFVRNGKQNVNNSEQKTVVSKGGIILWQGRKQNRYS